MSAAASVRQKRGNARREALVQAAAESVWLDGYAESSLAKIAKRADVPVGNVYYYYKTKADIAEAVAAFFERQTEDLVASIVAEADEPKARLSLLITRLRATQKERVRHGCPIHAAVRGFRGDAPAASARAAKSFDVLSTFIASEFKRSGVRPSVANLQARGCVAAWQGGIALAYAMQEPSILAEAFHRIEQMMGLRNASG